MRRSSVSAARKRKADAQVTGDELGAHVSTAGGVQHAPARAALLNARVLQVFTKQPSRWAEPLLSEQTCAAFHAECEKHRITFAAAHDSYLINLGTPDPVLFERSRAVFAGELQRCLQLGLDALVTHPGNATDGNVPRALQQNARAIAQALAAVKGSTRVLFEITAGSGNALGASFEQLAELLHALAPLEDRIGICLDTCHLWAAGYDLINDYENVWARFDAQIGLHRIQLFHLNDSATALGSRRDRHAHIGRGQLGPEPFRRLLNDERFRHIPKIIETPKDDDVLAADRRNLRRLRSYRLPAAGSDVQ